MTKNRHMSHLEIACQNLKSEDIELLLKYARKEVLKLKESKEK